VTRPAAFTIDLTPGEVMRLHDEIGDIPKKYIGTKLMELYRRLDSLCGLEWPGDDTEKARKR
jgi:hypothetical protein